MMVTCPTCRKPVDSKLSRCPWDGTLLGAVVMDPLLGTALAGRYLLQRCIGDRGRSRLYTAEEVGTGRALLATVLVLPRLKNEDFERFRAMAEKVNSIEHTSFSHIRDFGRTEQGSVFIIEEGEVWHQLGQELVLKGRLSPTLALNFTIQLLDGLDHLHGKGVYHGGLSPAGLRLLFDDKGTLQLQIPISEIPCRLLDPELDPQDLNYTHPDRIKGPLNDLHAAILILAEMLTGQAPDRSLPEAQDLSRINQEDEVGAGLHRVILRGLGRHGEKYTSSWEMRRDLDNLMGRSRFGRYDLLHRLAEGGMGEIYLARAVGIEGIDINRLCVIKTVRTNLIQSSEFVTRFIAEARVLASLSHGNIVPVYDVGKVGTVFYIAMEYVIGQDLRKILNRAAKEKKRMSVPLAIFIAKELANGLAYAHRAKVRGIGGLVHRDVSPHNTMVSYDGEVKLIDFGLAQVEAELTKQENGTVMGKVCYISPEQAKAENLDQRTDIYSAGLVLFELLTGEPFFNQRTIAEVLNHVSNPTLEPPSARVSGIPKEVDQICLRAMAPKRKDRYLSAGALRDDLTAALARIAPRTNPEEVGFFVRSLFKSEQKDEETMLSDLSLTMPPIQVSKKDATATGVVLAGFDQDSGQAISLLSGDPTPIQLAETIKGERKHSGARTAAGDSAAALQSPDEARRDPFTFPSVDPQSTVELASKPNWNIPIIISMIIALLGGITAFWGFRIAQRSTTDRSKETERALKAALDQVTQWNNHKPAVQQPDATVTPKVGIQTPARVANPVKRVKPNGQLDHTLRVDKNGMPQPCLVWISGCEDCQLDLNRGAKQIALPLEEPLFLTAGQVHTLKVVRKGLSPLIKKVQCNDGEHFNLVLSTTAFD